MPGLRGKISASAAVFTKDDRTRKRVRKKTGKDREKVSITILCLFVYHKKIDAVIYQISTCIQLIVINT